MFYTYICVSTVEGDMSKIMLNLSEGFEINAKIITEHARRTGQYLHS